MPKRADNTLTVEPVVTDLFLPTLRSMFSGDVAVHCSNLLQLKPIALFFSEQQREQDRANQLYEPFMQTMGIAPKRTLQRNFGCLRWRPRGASSASSPSANSSSSKLITRYSNCHRHV